jgi:hypothetical protein
MVTMIMRTIIGCGDEVTVAKTVWTLLSVLWDRRDHKDHRVYKVPPV